MSAAVCTFESLQDAIAHLAENHVDLAEMAGKIRVVATPEGVQIEANDDDAGMLFDSASSHLKPALEGFLRELTPMLTARTEPIEIQGHTDATQFSRGANKTNWELSFERATEARKILERNGLDPGRVGAVQRGHRPRLDAARGARPTVLAEEPPADDLAADDPVGPVAPAAATLTRGRP